MAAPSRQQLLKIEYLLIDESNHLLADISAALPDGREQALIKTATKINSQEELSEKELRHVVRVAVIQELLEFLDNELHPPPRPRPCLVRAESLEGLAQGL